MVNGSQSRPLPDIALLDEEARASQRQGDYARSIPLWDQLCGICPDNSDYPLALGLDLGSAGRRAEGDEVLRRGVRAHPNSMWLLFHWAMLAFTDGRLDAAEQRARKLLDRFSDRRVCFELLGDIAVQQREMRSAEHHYEAALTREPDQVCAEKLSFARIYGHLSQRFPLPSIRLNDFKNQADYATLVINLDHNPERLVSTEEAFDASPAPFYRIPGIRGSYLPTASSRLLTGGGLLRKGTLGTFLTHVAAWETVADFEFDYCLIIEDDASPIIDLPTRASALGIPDDFDLCFVNERMQCQVEPYDSLPRKFQARSPIEALVDWPKDKNAPGADGYFLSGAGARKLLEFISQDGFAGDVDWRLLRYSIPSGGQAHLPEDSIAFNVLQKMEGRVSRIPEGIHALPLSDTNLKSGEHTDHRR